LFAYALARRLEDSGVTSNCMNPGRTATKMLAAAFPGQPGRPVAEAAGVVAYLALSPAVARTTGAYFEGTAPVRSSAESYDVGLQERLWEASERLVGLAG
jgi:NAD(P)-dependent dehydrogenase (short-subunit alcohol dehydrogenase family)